MVERVGPVNYRIRRSAKSKEFIVHVDKLQHYLSPDTSSGTSVTAEVGDDNAYNMHDDTNLHLSRRTGQQDRKDSPLDTGNRW